MAISKTKSFSSPLLVRPAPLKGESLRGYLLRVGERNGCGKGMNLLTELTGNYGRQYMVSDQAVHNIAQSLSLSREKVEAISYRAVASDAKNQCLFFGHAISVNHLRSQHPAVCPECLAEQDAISGLWDLRIVCACPHHGKWLIDLCPECGESLKWGRSRVARCQCGFDLRTAETKPASSEVLVLTALIYEQALNDLPSLVECSLGYPPEVRKISLNDLLGLFRYTADVLLPGHPVSQEACAEGSERFSKHSQASVLMARLFKAWPNELSLVLSEFYLFDGDPTVVPTALSVKEFNTRYRRVMELGLDSKSFCMNAPDFFKQALRQFRNEHRISDTGAGRYLNPSLVFRSPEGLRALTWGVCQEAFGLQQEVENPDEVTLFSLYLEKRAEFLDEIVTPREAMQWLGCSTVHLMDLVDLKRLHPVASNDFLKKEVADLVAWFDCIAVEIEGARYGEIYLRLTSFKPMGRAQFSRLVLAISKKEIKLYKRGHDPSRSLSDLYVLLSDLRKAGHWRWPGTLGKFSI